VRTKQVTVSHLGGPHSLFDLLGIPEGQRGSWSIKMQSPATNTQDVLWGDKNQQVMILAATGITEETIPGINLKGLYLKTITAPQLLNVTIWQ
jgi:hypothetical protein